MRARRRLAFATIALLLAAAGCQAILDLDDPVIIRPEEDASTDANVTPDTSAPLDAAPNIDAGPDVVQGGGCWADAALVENVWPDYLDTPVPQPRAATGISNRASYDASVPGEVYDEITKLTWLVETDGGTSPTGTNAEAVAACGARSARLPTRMELVTIQNWYPPDDATIGADPEFFPDTVDAYYRTSTPTSSNILWGWAAYFGAIGFGVNSAYPLTTTLPYRCVRGPSLPTLPAHRYEVSATCGIVRDVRTRLEWERGRGKQGKYTQAEGHCETLPKLGRNEWRIPTYSELLSIVFTKRENPAVDPLAFETEQGVYWSSSLPGRTPNNRIVVPFSDGNTTGVRNESVADVWVRCVRTMD